MTSYIPLYVSFPLSNISFQLYWLRYVVSILLAFLPASFSIVMLISLIALQPVSSSSDDLHLFPFLSSLITLNYRPGYFTVIPQAFPLFSTPSWLLPYSISQDNHYMIYTHKIPEKIPIYLYRLLFICS